jgi:hypothetical protein
MKKVIMLFKRYPNLMLAIIIFMMGIASGVLIKMMD